MGSDRMQRGQWHAVTAGFLGWALDAFDFFVVVFLVDTLAGAFSVDKKAIIWTLTATLAMRPLGALLFGMMADRYGRRLPMMANVVFFSTVGFLCGFAPNYQVFLVLRALYGIGMGGEWGIGASLALESTPRKWRGLLSGILQAGYPVGYLLAAVAARTVFPALGWRWMFWIGGLPALLALYIRSNVPESRAWVEHRKHSFRAILGEVGRYKGRLAYLVLMMTLFMFLSHGTQDLYPDFLKTAHGVSATMVANLAILYNVGAIIGALIFGQLSQRYGRRRIIVLALGLCAITLPFWGFGGSVLVLAGAAFMMQVGVQGAWGIVPAHLNEMVPDGVRGLMPGLAYQLGILFAAGTNTIEYALRDRVGYQWALVGFEAVTILALATVVLLGREEHDRRFHSGH
jgi:SHS family lactate transporter-like MFS transporter